MKLIEKLSDQISEELHDAEKYIKCALTYRADRPELARTYYQLSEQELGHMEALHRQVVQLIEEYRRNNGEPPAEMQARYDWMHEKHIEHAADIRILQAAFNK